MPSTSLATEYRLPDGTVTRDFPFSIGDEAEGAGTMEPVYRSFPGWMTELKDMRRVQELPEAFTDYIRFIESEVGVPVTILSVGPDREQTIILND